MASLALFARIFSLANWICCWVAGTTSRCSSAARLAITFIITMLSMKLRLAGPRTWARYCAGSPSIRFSNWAAVMVSVPIVATTRLGSWASNGLGAGALSGVAGAWAAGLGAGAARLGGADGLGAGGCPNAVAISVTDKRG